jgi:hypothetical protein|tara:strand:- start:535 stop:639 length:105 start_codon:yes stop_codon:yes gene_type:complete
MGLGIGTSIDLGEEGQLGGFSAYYPFKLLTYLAS